MLLVAGTRFGPYEIVSLLGAGGMGEVYRAKDGRLGRDVAVKVLPEAFASDADRRGRFEREAQAVAALSHPNVVALFDTGLHDGRAFVVMELLAGETLRERLSKGAVPVRKAVDIAVQVARGLGAAHGKGLVHRDLKPENVFVLDDGQVKILDFGLARQAASSDHTGATRTVAVTDPGTVMGTVGYMAPEQVRGQAVDARADVFAFGTVLYELLSGRRAFQGETPADTLTAILTQDPPELSGSRPDLSPALDRIVRHCLEKNPNERFQSARDIAFALEALSGSAISSGPVVVDQAPASARARRWWTAALALAAGLGAGAYVGATLFATHETPVAFEARTWDAQWITNARFATDEETIVFSAARSGNSPSVFAIRPGSQLPQPIGPAGTHLIAMSSRGDLAVLTGAESQHHRVFVGTLARMTIDGAQRPILERVTDADWAPDGETLAVVHVVEGESQLEYPIGHRLHRSAGYLSDVRVSPDGTRVAFFEHAIRTDNRGLVKVVDQSGRVTVLTEEYWGMEGLAWLPDGRSLMFSASTNAAYQPYIVDAFGRQPARQAFSSAGETVIFDVSPAGRMLAARNDNHHSIWGRAPGQTAEREYPWLDFPTAGYFSADGKMLVFTDLNESAGADYAVSLRMLDGSPVVRLGPGGGFGPSRDAKWVLALVPSTQQMVLYPTGAGRPVELERGPIATYRYVAQWFADGKRVLICGTERSGESRCYEQRIDGGPPTAITPAGVDGAWLASDDRTLLYHASGGYRLTTLGSDARHRSISLTANDTPLEFSRDGKSVFVQSGTGIPARVERVDLSTGARALVRELAPPDRSGIIEIGVDQWMNDGEVYTCRTLRSLSKLFVVSRQ